MKNILDKYNLNRNWGVPFEVEKQINEEVRDIEKESVSSGSWLAISEFANIREAQQLLPEVIKAMGYTYEECLDLMEECKFNNDILRPIVEKVFNV